MLVLTTSICPPNPPRPPRPVSTRVRVPASEEHAFVRRCGGARLPLGGADDVRVAVSDVADVVYTVEVPPPLPVVEELPPEAVSRPAAAGRA